MARYLQSFLSFNISAVVTTSLSIELGLICETRRQVKKVPGPELNTNIDNQPMFIINVPDC